MEFYDDDLIGDEFLGSLSFDIGEELRKLPLDCRNAEWHQAFPLETVHPAIGHTDAQILLVLHTFMFVQYRTTTGMLQHFAGHLDTLPRHDQAVELAPDQVCSLSTLSGMSGISGIMLSGISGIVVSPKRQHTLFC